MCGLSAVNSDFTLARLLWRLSFICPKCPIADDASICVWCLEFGRNESVAQMVVVWPAY
jgi:hypothetical protein